MNFTEETKRNNMRRIMRGWRSALFCIIRSWSKSTRSRVMKLDQGIFFVSIYSFKEEFQDVFKDIMFSQQCTSVFCLCMTEFLCVSFSENTVLLANSVPFLCAITFQIWQICFSGNEVLYAVSIVLLFFYERFILHSFLF